jgi:transcriptional regulator with XRE-family HTH domain
LKNYTLAGSDKMFSGERLKEIRIKKGMTQEKLGEIIGVTKGTISLYENNQRKPKLENIIELMYALGISADYLLGADVIVEIKNEEDPKYRLLTNDEVKFIEELRKDSFIYDLLFQDPKRGIEIIKKRL